MALQDLINIRPSTANKIGISEERIEAIKPQLRQYIAFWREYPDLFVDFMATGGDPDRKDAFKLFSYLRVFLRIAMRYRYVYAVYPRAFSKSFLAVLVQMIRCILYPGSKIFSTAGGKQLAADILGEKVDDICTKIPAFEREIDRRPGKTKHSKDLVTFVFKNGSVLDNVAASEKSRGKRRHGGIIEESASIDGKILQEVIVPMVNVSRRCLDGTTQENESVNKSFIYITTAGYKNTFAYDKLIQILVQMVIDPTKYFVLGGTYKVPLVFGMLSKDFVSELKRDTTFNQASFEREYVSIWSGTSEGAFFDGEAFDRNRTIQRPEYEHSGKSSIHSFYVIAVDVGRKGCDTVIVPIKVTPQNVGQAHKSIVNIYTLSDTHLEDQTIFIKRLYYKYNAKRLVIDGNGLGIGLLDYMVKSQQDPLNGLTYPDFGIFNDDEGFYKLYKTYDTVQDIIYVIKANAPINTEAHANLQVQLSSGKLRLLIDERIAKQKLLATKAGLAMSPEQRDSYLRPYTNTDFLKLELMNLREENEGVNIILKQASKRIGKDKVSAVEYGLYYIKQYEENKKKKKRFNAKEWAFYN